MTGVRWHYVALVFAGLLVALYFLRAVYPDCAYDCYTYHRFILVTGEAASPYRYRVLSPVMAEAISLLIPGDRMVANAAAYTVLHALLFPLMFVMIYRWMRVWLNADRALIGVLIFVALIPLGMHVYFISAYSVTEVLLFSVGLLMLVQTRVNLIGFCALVVLATINRETAFVLPVALFAVTRNWRMSAIAVALWFSVYAALWITLGATAHAMPIAQAWRNNTGEFLNTAVLHNLFMAPVWIGAAINYRRAHPVLKRLMLVAAVYMPFALAFGQWYEVRLQWLMLPLLLPLALGGDAHDRGDVSVHVGGADGGRAD